MTAAALALRHASAEQTALDRPNVLWLVRYDMVRTVRDERYRYIRNYSPHRIYGQHVAFEWQKDSYRAWEAAHLAGRLNPVQERFFRDKPAEEFYDVVADPDQIENLIDVPAHRERIASMRGALGAHMVETNDNGFSPESSPLEGYDQSRAPGAYPLDRVLRLANRVIQRDPRNVAEFDRLLGDDNEVMRYWAAQDLLMLKARAASARSSLKARARRGHGYLHPQRRPLSQSRARRDLHAGITDIHRHWSAQDVTARSENPSTHQQAVSSVRDS